MVNEDERGDSMNDTVGYEQNYPEPTLVTLPNPEEPQKELTEGERKLLRKQYVTVQLPRVLACGHRLDLSRQPRHRNCEHCWFSWLNEHGEIVQQLDEMFTQHGPELIIQLQGIKFYNMWRKFMSTVANWKQENETV
jgi:hypothetical protein